MFLQRLCDDHDACVPSMRKAVSYQQGMYKHQMTGGFLHFLGLLEKMLPASEFPEAKDALLKQFSQGFLDPDIQHTLENTVPPGDAKSIAAFRPDLLGFACAMIFLRSKSPCLVLR